jgi:para-nitrobenzyl esterase
MPFEPVIDGDLLPVLPIAGIAAGAGSDIDVLVGTNLEEQRLFLVPTGAIGYINASILGMASAAYGLPAEALEVYRSSRPEASPGDLLAAISTDWFFRIPAIRLAEAHARGTGSTHMYEFAWRSPLFRGKLGACHALEIGFAFDTLDSSGAEKLTGPNPPQALADAMHQAWVAFAKAGNPGWDEYETESRKVMRFDERSGVVVNPASEERELWEGIR